MGPSSARRIYHSGRWMPDASSTSTERLRIQLYFSSQLRVAIGYSTYVACICGELDIESLETMKFF